MRRILAAGLVVAGLLALAGRGEATEGGGTIYPQGPEGFLLGVLPPPGTYWINYVNYYHAGRFNDRSGNSAVPGFRLDAAAEIVRLLHVTPLNILGASYGVQIFVPLLYVDAAAAGTSQSKVGVADLTVSPLILGWHAGNFHFVFATDLNIPTGDFNRRDLVNISRNYFEIEPVFAFSYLDPEGPDLSIKLMYDFNFTNPDTDYRSGQEFHFDYAAGWNIDNWALGGAGYYYHQTTDDRVNGVRVGPDGFRGEAFAIGPSVRFTLADVNVMGTWQHEVFTYNRPSGDKFWLKTIVRF